MRDDEIGRAIRLLRQRRGWRQQDLADRAAVSRWAVAEVEAGRGEELPLRSLRAMTHALGSRLTIALDWRGHEIRRLLDAENAALQAATRSFLERLGWLGRAEVTFNHFGERGSVDLLAFARRDRPRHRDQDHDRRCATTAVDPRHQKATCAPDRVLAPVARRHGGTSPRRRRRHHESASPRCPCIALRRPGPARPCGYPLASGAHARHWRGLAAREVATCPWERR